MEVPLNVLSLKLVQVSGNAVKFETPRANTSQ